jgi:peptidoglycan hydrolase-like protein with peptidoglycan-binding domain
MLRNMYAIVALAALPSQALSQADTTRRPDTTRVPQSQDTTRRMPAEARGEVDRARLGARFREGLPNYGLSSDQAIEVQQALTRAGCDVGVADGIAGPQTLRGIECFRRQQNLLDADLESLFTALQVSFARPPAPVPAPAEPPAPPRRDSTVLPQVLRQTNWAAVRDSALKRDSLRRDSLARDSTRRDTTARRDTTTRPEEE